MKVLWLSHLLPFPPQGGVMQRSFNLLKEVSKKNEVYLFALNQKAWLPMKEDVNRARNEFMKFCKRVDIFDLPSDKSKYAWYKLVGKSFFTKNPYTVNWTMSREMQNSIKQMLKRSQVDVIHCDTIGLAEYLKNIEKIPKVLNHHNIESHMMLRRAKKENNLLKKLYFYVEGKKLKKYEKIFCPLFDRNITVSELDKNRLQSLLPNLIIDVVPNGVDVEYFQSRNREAFSNNIIFVGSMDWYPNEDAVIFFIKNIWPLVKKKCRNATFTIVGRKPGSKVKRLVNDDSSIKITGYVDDVRPFFDMSRVFVCPIRDGGGTKLKLLDAMAMEKAIVTTSVGAEGLEVKNGKHVLIADDYKSFALNIIRLYEDLNFAKYLGQNARKLVVERYSWESIGRKLNDVYFSVR